MLCGMYGRSPSLSSFAPSLPLRRGDGSTLTLDGSRCAVMAILNLTPDSFSDGGLYSDPSAALVRAQALIAAGADILDLGAESTRPGAQPIEPEEEWRRLEQVLLPLGKAALPAVLSVDTMHAETARRAAQVGVRMLNLTFPQAFLSEGGDPALLSAFDGIILMHARGNPQSMRELTDYGQDLCQTVVDELREIAASISPAMAKVPSMVMADSKEAALFSRLIFDPGLGFAKTAAQSLLLLSRLDWLRGALGGRLLIGASRKSMLYTITGLPVRDRLVPSTVAAAFAAYLGADIVRVHDVAETVAALRVAEAVRAARGEGA